MFCPKCGKENPDGAKFCAGCGYQFPAAASNPGSVQAPQPLPATSQAMPAMAGKPSGMGSAAASLAAGGITPQGRRIILSVLSVVILVIACFVPVFKTDADVYRYSNLGADAVDGISSLSTSLGGKSYDSSAMRFDEAYSLFGLDDYTTSVAYYNAQKNLSFSTPQVPRYFLYIGLAFCALCAFGIYRTVKLGKCRVMLGFFLAVFLFYVFVVELLREAVGTSDLWPHMDGIVYFMLVLSVIALVLGVYYRRKGLLGDGE